MPITATSTRKSTLRQLAEDLGLSITTVSRGLADYADVADATRHRIRTRASQLGYVPNRVGQMLRTGRSGFVGLVLPLGDPPQIDPFLGEFVAGLGEGLVARKQDLFLATAAPNQSEMSVLRHVVESGRADGLVLTRIAEHDERVEYLATRGFPFITHGRTEQLSQPYSWVDTDGADAFGRAFDLLYNLGHRRFALVSITELMHFRRDREEGLAAAVARTGDADVSVQMHRTPRFDRRARHRLVQSLLQAVEPPTAILALTDEIALAVLHEAATLGIAVPNELSVVGFDNLPEAAYVTPGLTTFDQSTRTTAIELAHMLVDLIEGNHTDRQRLIQPELISRGSHGPAP